MDIKRYDMEVEPDIDEDGHFIKPLPVETKDGKWVGFDDCLKTVEKLESKIKEGEKAIEELAKMKIINYLIDKTCRVCDRLKPSCGMDCGRLNGSQIDLFETLSSTCFDTDETITHIQRMCKLNYNQSKRVLDYLKSPRTKTFQNLKKAKEVVKSVSEDPIYSPEELEKKLVTGSVVRFGEEFCKFFERGYLRPGLECRIFNMTYNIETEIDETVDPPNTEKLPSLKLSPDFVYSIFHLFGKNLENFMDCEIVEANEETKTTRILDRKEIENQIKSLLSKLKKGEKVDILPNQLKNPFCDSCKEKDCLISFDDEYCEMTRVYLSKKGNSHQTFKTEFSNLVSECKAAQCVDDMWLVLYKMDKKLSAIV